MALLGFGKSDQNHENGLGKPLLPEEKTLWPTDRNDISSSSVTASTKKNVSSGNKPLPLKQRTSSSSNQRDYNQQTWLSLLVLVKFREFFVTVDHFSIWRRHLAWANDDGKDLRTYMTQRYASNMVFMSLLLSTELGEYGSSRGRLNINFKMRFGNTYHPSACIHRLFCRCSFQFRPCHYRGATKSCQLTAWHYILLGGITHHHFSPLHHTESHFDLYSLGHGQFH